MEQPIGRSTMDISGRVAPHSIGLHMRRRNSQTDTDSRHARTCSREGAPPCACMAFSPLGVCECVALPDGGLAIAACNPAAEHILGLPADRLIGRSVSEVFPHLAAGLLGEALRSVALGGRPIGPIDVRFTRHDGERVVQFSAFGVSAGRAACVFTDMTEYARGGAMLRRLLEIGCAPGGPNFLCDTALSLAGLLNAVVVCVAERAPDAPERMTTLALAMDGIAGENIAFDASLSPCGDVLHRALFAHRIGLGARYPQDPLVQISAGQAFVGVPLPDSAGQPVGVLAAIFAEPLDEHAWIESALRTLAPRVGGEIERRRALAALHESEGRFRALVERSTDVTLVIDYGAEIIFENPATSRVLGYPPGGLIGKNALDLVHPEDLSMVQGRLVDLAQRKSTGRPLQVRMRHHDDRWLHLELMGENLLADPTVRGFLVTARDVSDRLAAEEALRVSEKRFRSYFDTPLVGSAIWLPDGRCAEANERMCQMLGYTRDELIGMTWYDLTVDVDRAADAMALAAARAGSTRSFVREKRYRRKDGSVVSAIVSSRCVFGAGDVLVHIVSVVEDLDERRRMEAALQASEARHRQLVELSNEWAWETDACGVLTFSSERVREFLGYTAGEVLGRTVFDLMPPDEAERVTGILTPIVENRLPFRGIPYVALRKDGERVWLCANGAPCTDEMGEFAGYRGVTCEASRAVGAPSSEPAPAAAPAPQPVVRVA